ncbi:hypothetical protein BpHYR1_007250 [Brachionus plicatilis]|uniref:Uncharacterized protein n=1 Tax=Brachionus plicatilis TaxID=10195 RepID=A0A3M7T7U0_BRAPC|nr:hypothetical protein BpHYR1_007250 [Brachionus plicatilis]
MTKNFADSAKKFPASEVHESIKLKCFINLRRTSHRDKIKPQRALPNEKIKRKCVRFNSVV